MAAMSPPQICRRRPLQLATARGPIYDKERVLLAVKIPAASFECVLWRGSPSYCRTTFLVVLSTLDRDLIDRCLKGMPQGWQDFVDRFIGLFVHIVDFSAKRSKVELDQQQRDDIVFDILKSIVDDKYDILRKFERNCSLATYLAVVARRVTMANLIAIHKARQAGAGVTPGAQGGSPGSQGGSPGAQESSPGAATESS